MNRGRRTIRLAKWAGVGLCVVVAVAWAVSLRWGFGLDASRFTAGVASGEFIVLTPGPLDEGIDWMFGRAEPLYRLWPEIELYPSESLVFIPLWLPLALLALPTALLFWLDRRKPRPGFCACGYDLTGNVSGVCPECGVRVR